MKKTKKPLVEVKENYYVNKDEVCNFIRASTNEDEWEAYEKIYDFNTLVDEDHRENVTPYDLQTMYMLNKHMLCLLRDGMFLEGEDFENNLSTLQRKLDHEQTEEENKPLRLIDLHILLRDIVGQCTAPMVNPLSDLLGIAAMMSMLDED